jgi:hypothetical protein
MKLKLTPTLIVSIILILFGIYFILSGIGGNLGPPVGMIIIGVGLIFLLLHFLLRKVFKTKIRNQFITELLLLILIGFFYFKNNEKVILHIPKNFQGYIILVYGVDGEPKLESNNIFNSNVDITVPTSGIILTSNKFPKNTVIVDSSDEKIKTLQPGYGIPTANDTLRCGDEKYVLDIFVFGNLPPNWDYNTDTAKRNVSKELACKLLSN